MDKYSGNAGTSIDSGPLVFAQKTALKVSLMTSLSIGSLGNRKGSGIAKLLSSSYVGARWCHFENNF